MEIERKFLVAAAEVQSIIGQAVRCLEIHQGYLSSRSGERRLRLVNEDGEIRYWETIKRGSGLCREEEESEISESSFSLQWPETGRQRIEKTRHCLGFHIEGVKEVNLDIYRGRLAPLVVVEVEFDSTEAAGAFAPPHWFGPEVTHDERYKNGHLAIHGLPGTLETGNTGR